MITSQSDLQNLEFWGKYLLYFATNIQKTIKKRKIPPKQNKKHMQ